MIHIMKWFEKLPLTQKKRDTPVNIDRLPTKDFRIQIFLAATDRSVRQQCDQQGSEGDEFLGIEGERILQTSWMGKITSFCGDKVLLWGMFSRFRIPRRKGPTDETSSDAHFPVMN